MAVDSESETATDERGAYELFFESDERGESVLEVIADGTSLRRGRSRVQPVRR